MSLDDVWTCAVGFEDALQRELGASRVLAPGLVSSAAAAVLADPAFARQRLPAAVEVRAASVAGLAQAAFDRLAAPIDEPGPWVLHVWDATASEPSLALAGRAALVSAALDERLVRLRKRASRRRVEPDASWPGELPLVAQVALTGRDAALVSVARAVALPAGAPWPDPRWRGGWRAVPDDGRQAPSSAYRKAEEAYALLGLAPAAGERVVDLGGAPGGWTWTALRRGARVVAVDRSPLEAPCAGHPDLDERIGDALRFEPDGPVDWLLCDVITTPDRTLELLERWLGRGLCARFVVNVKFKGDARGDALRALSDLLARHAVSARVKHLVHDKNEVTAFGRVTSAPPRRPD